MFPPTFVTLPTTPDTSRRGTNERLPIDRIKSYFVVAWDAKFSVLDLYDGESIYVALTPEEIDARIDAALRKTAVMLDDVRRRL